MSWLIPSALGIAGAAALVAVALHFIARSRPLAETLPTARFVPERPVYARTRSFALTDLLLLLLRIAALAAIGVAVAGPTLNRGGRVARIVVVDRSRAVASLNEARDSIKALASTNDVVIPFDSAAGRATSVAALDSLSAVPVRGSLSAALAAATRAAVLVSQSADSVELVFVSPFSREETDEATSHLRDSWPGRVRVVAVQPAPDRRVTSPVEMRAGANDAVVAGLSLAGARSSASAARLVRGTLTAADSAWAGMARHLLVHWPASDSDASWTRRVNIDAIGGVTSGTSTLVARFPRLWVLDGSVVARWADGEPAAVEHAVGAGCIRDVGVLIDQASDLTLRAPFRQFAASMLAPCGGARVADPIDAAARAKFAGTGALAAASVLRDRSVEWSNWTSWLLALGALLLLIELAVRRSTRGAA